MITFNHEKYIEQAVLSVLMQETDFDYELIIGEDCSTDRTREILLELQKQHPDKIKLVLNPENLGMIPNSVNVLGMASGKYIALLEGDDYWTSPHKLQRQVDYMEAHPECLLCFHGFEVIHEGRPDLSPHVIKPLPNVPNKKIGFASMQTGTFVLRNRKELPAWFRELRASGEWPLITWVLMQGGKISAVTDEAMSVYRKHEAGVSMHPQVARGLDKLHDFRVVTQQMTSKQRKQIFHSPLFGIHLYLCRAYISEGNLSKARYHFVQYIYYRRPRSKNEIVKALKIFLEAYFPRAYIVLKKRSANPIIKV